MNQPVRFSAETRPRDLRFTIAQFYQMEEAGLFEDLRRTELLDGRISVVNALHMPHGRTTFALGVALLDAVRGRDDLEVVLDVSIELGLNNLPQPDIIIWSPVEAAKGAPDGSVRLVIEVADSSEKRDLGRKKRIYARHGIAEYWVAVLRTRRIERFAEPVRDSYARHDSFAFGDRVEAVTLPGVALPEGALPR